MHIQGIGLGRVLASEEKPSLVHHRDREQIQERRGGHAGTERQEEQYVQSSLSLVHRSLCWWAQTREFGVRQLMYILVREYGDEGRGTRAEGRG